MKTVNILGNGSLELTVTFEPYKSLMSLIGLCIRIAELFPVEIIEFFRMFYEKRMRDNIDGTLSQSRLLIEDTFSASEIRNTALCRDTCSAQKNNIIRLGYQLLEPV